MGLLLFIGQCSAIEPGGCSQNWLGPYALLTGSTLDEARQVNVGAKIAIRHEQAAGAAQFESYESQSEGRQKYGLVVCEPQRPVLRESDMFKADKDVEINFLIDDLNDLLQIHYELLAGYRTILSLARDAQMKSAVEILINEHSMQIGALSLVVRRYGGETRGGGSSGRMAVKLRTVAGQPSQSSAMYSVMKKNEQQLVTEYERSVRTLSAVPGLETVLAENLTVGKQRVKTIDDLLGKVQCNRVKVGVC